MQCPNCDQEFVQNPLRKRQTSNDGVHQPLPQQRLPDRPKIEGIIDYEHCLNLDCSRFDLFRPSHV